MACYKKIGDKWYTETQIKSWQRLGEQLATATDPNTIQSIKDKVKTILDSGLTDPSLAPDSTTKAQKKKLAALAKRIKRRVNKTSLLDSKGIKEQVKTLLNLPLHRIIDSDLADKVNKLLTDLNKGTVPEVDAAAVSKLLSDVDLHLRQNEQIAKTLNTKADIDEELDSVKEKIKELEEADISIDNLRSPRSRYSRIASKIRNAEDALNRLDLSKKDANEVTDATKVRNAIDTINESLDEFVAKFDSQIEKSTRDLNKEIKKEAKNIDLESLPEYERLIVSDFMDIIAEAGDLSLRDAILAMRAIDDINNSAFIPSFGLSYLNSKINAETLASEANIADFNESVNALPQMDYRFWKDIGKKMLLAPVRSDLKKIVGKFKRAEFSTWEDITGMSKNPILTFITDPIIVAGNRMKEAVESDIRKFQDVMFPELEGKAIVRALKRSKDGTFGRLSDVLKQLNSTENRVSRIALGMVMIERRWNHLYFDSDKPKTKGMWHKVMNDGDQRNKLSLKEKRTHDAAFKSLPKNPDGSIDVDKALQELTPDQKRMFEFLEKMFDGNSELGLKQKAVSAQRGILNNFDSFYFPFLRINKDGVSPEDGNVQSLLLGKVKISSDRAKAVGDSTPGMMQADVFSAFTNYTNNVNRDYHLREPIKNARVFFNRLHKKSEGNAKTVANALRTALEKNLLHSLGHKIKSSLDIFTDKILNSTYAYYLTSIKRSLAAEPAAEIGRTTFGGDLISFKDLPKNAKDQFNSIYKTAVSRLKGVRIDEKGKLVFGDAKPSDLKRFLEFTGSPFAKNFSRQFSNTARPSADGVVSDITTGIGQIPTSTVFITQWAPSFRKHYKKLTNNSEFDFSKIDDVKFLKDNRINIKKAAALANRDTAKLTGFPTQLGGATANSFLFFWQLDANDRPKFYKLNNFLSSFGRRDFTLVRQGFKDLGLFLAGLAGSKELKRYQASTPQQAVRNIISSTVFGASYALIMSYLGGLTIELFTDDEDELSDYEKSQLENYRNGVFNKEDILENLAGYAVFIMSSKLGYFSKGIPLWLAGAHMTSLENDKKNTKSKRVKGEIDDQIRDIKNISKSLFYSEPLVFNSSNPFSNTSLEEGLGLLPGIGAFLDFGLDAERSKDQFNTAKAFGEGEEDALMFLITDIVKLTMLTSGKKIPFLKDFVTSQYDDRSTLRKRLKAEQKRR